jgi:hypothetical protein
MRTDDQKCADLTSALVRFQDAATDLLVVWEACGDDPGDALADYPSSWPSFDELVAQAQALNVRADYVFRDRA